MAHPYHHALSSVRRWGGRVEDYQPIHDWFDESKAFLADIRHRALRHHAEGIFLCERVFGVTVTNSDGRAVPVRWIGEQHVKEDLGRIPAASDWLRAIRPEPWMLRTGDSRMCDEPEQSDPADSAKSDGRCEAAGGGAGTRAAESPSATPALNPITESK